MEIRSFLNTQTTPGGTSNHAVVKVFEISGGFFLLVLMFDVMITCRPVDDTYDFMHCADVA